MTNLETLGGMGGLLLGFLLTVAVLSFVVRDNPLYRLAVHMLIGVSAGYAVVVLIRDVFSPLFESLLEERSVNTFIWIIPLILTLILLTKAFPSSAWIGNISMGALIGIGSAVSLVGAIAGTLVPQILVQYQEALLGLVVAVLAILALAYFFFSARVNQEGEVALSSWYPFVSGGGRTVITIALAGLFAAVLSTSLVLLTQRINFFIDEFALLFESLLS
jgi:hypothetical protein